jgi:hypothetical protein
MVVSKVLWGSERHQEFEEVKLCNDCTFVNFIVLIVIMKVLWKSKRN